MPSENLIAVVKELSELGAKATQLKNAVIYKSIGGI